MTPQSSATEDDYSEEEEKLTERCFAGADKDLNQPAESGGPGPEPGPAFFLLTLN